MRSVAKHVEHQPAVSTIPMTSMKGIFLSITHLSFDETAKYGQLGRWPSTHQFQARWPSFLDRGLEWHRESLEIKFSGAPTDGEKALFHISPFSVGYVDGFNKAIIMLAIMTLITDVVSWLCYDLSCCIFFCFSDNFHGFKAIIQHQPNNNQGRDWGSNGRRLGVLQGSGIHALCQVQLHQACPTRKFSLWCVEYLDNHLIRFSHGGTPMLFKWFKFKVYVSPHVPIWHSSWTQALPIELQKRWSHLPWICCFFSRKR